MKVRVTVTLDVDPAAWMTDYGVAREDVRADVQSWAFHLLHDALVMNGMQA